MEAMVVDPTQQREVTKWIEVRHQAFYLHVVVLHSQRLTKEGKIKKEETKMKFYTISYFKFEKTFEVYPRLFTKRKDAEEFCVFLRSSGHSNVKITICTL